MATRLAGGSDALALLANAIASSATLVVLILALGPVSGAHFNPVVSLTEAVTGALPWGALPGRIAVQCLSALAGVLAAHAMFGLPLIQVSGRVRTRPAQWLSEVIATFGLVATIQCCGRLRASAVPAAVGLYILGAYWFTASTSFANPALTLARGATDTFAGIRPADALIFVAAQCVGGLAGTAICGWLVPTGSRAPDPHHS